MPNDLIDVTMSNWLQTSLWRLHLSMVRAALSALAAPVAAPTLTPAAGATNYTVGYIPVAYSWATQDGQTAISGIATVLVTLTGQITVSSLAAALAAAGLPATSVNYFMGSQSYATALLAVAAPLYYAANGSGAALVLPNYPLVTAAAAPLTSTESVAAGCLGKGIDSTVNNLAAYFEGVAVAGGN